MHCGPSRGRSRVDEGGGAHKVRAKQALSPEWGGALPHDNLKIQHHYAISWHLALGFTRKNVHCPKNRGGGAAPGAPPLGSAPALRSCFGHTCSI